MNILLFPVGSFGDVHPMVGLGLTLAERGHQVTVITSEMFRPLVTRVGLRFEAIDTSDELEQALKLPDLFHPRRGFGILAREILLPWQRRQVEWVRKLNIPGETVIAGPSIAMGLHIAHEALGVPFVSVHLQPAIFWCARHPPKMVEHIPHGPTFPAWWNASIYWLANKIMVDPVLKGETNRFRAELGLPPVRRAIDLWHSPQKVIGLFPEWFAPPQAGWPANTVLTDFPRWDESLDTAMPPDVEQFLAAGTPPIAFTPGSGMTGAADFFQQSALACQQMGRRGILLTRFAEQIPPELPPGVVHVPYVPFSLLLPRCAALVSHGGIGTLSQALQAGIPHLVMPMSFDQPDNAARLQALGVGDKLLPRHYQANRIAQKLNHLLTSPEVHTACEKISQRMANNTALPDAADEVERPIRG
ncbi:MAG: glycosyltransferase [Pirellulaceae bacterium]